MNCIDIDLFHIRLKGRKMWIPKLQDSGHKKQSIGTEYTFSYCDVICNISKSSTYRIRISRICKVEKMY
jgi:hypothetical protein